MADNEERGKGGSINICISRERKEKTFLIIIKGLSFGEKMKNRGHKL